jgi:hypothetical protein
MVNNRKQSTNQHQDEQEPNLGTIFFSFLEKNFSTRSNFKRGWKNRRSEINLLTGSAISDYSYGSDH